MFIVYYDKYCCENVIKEIESIIVNGSKFVKRDEPYMMAVAYNNELKTGTLTVGYKIVIKSKDDKEYDVFQITEGDMINE